MKASVERAIAELSRPGTKKFRMAKQLVQISEDQPALLYPYFSAFRRLLGTENKIIQWTAIRIMGNLGTVDKQHRMAGSLDEYLAPIPGPSLITAANTIAGAAKIAGSHPRLAKKIISALLQVEHGRYPTTECRNVAIGQALAALAAIGPKAARAPGVLSFVKRQRHNTRRSTREQAESFLRKRGRESFFWDRRKKRLPTPFLKYWTRAS